MAELDQVKVVWRGLPGGDGLSVFYFTAGQAANALANLRSFFGNFTSLLPTALTLEFPGGGDVIDDGTGEAQRAWSAASPANLVGGSSAAWSAVSGAHVRWETGRFERGHRVRGRTFIVPLILAAYGNGTLASTTITTLKTAADSLVTISNQTFMVWHRPLKDYSVKPPILKEPGASFPITSTVVPTKVVYMRRRRDT